MHLRHELTTATWLVAASLVAAALNLGYIIITARMLGPAAYADVGSALAFIYVVTIVVSPVAQAAARQVAAIVGHAPERASGLRREIRRLVMPLAVVIAVASPLLAIAAARLFHFTSIFTPMFAFLSASVFLVVNTERGFLQGLGRFAAYNASTIVEAGARVLLVLVILHVSVTPSAALAVYVVALIIAGLVVFGTSGDARVAASNGEDRRAVIQTAGRLLLLMCGAAVFQNADMLAAKRWLSSEAAGHYAAAAAIARTFGVLFVPLYVLSGPLLVKEHASGRSVRAGALRLCGYYVVLCALPLLALILFGGEAMTLLYGPAYRAAGAIAAPLAGATVLGYVTLLAVQANVTLGDHAVPRLYAAMALVQIASLTLFHDSALAIVLTLYAVQAVLLVVIIAASGRRTAVSPPLQ